MDHHHHSPHNEHKPAGRENHYKLAFSATLHCLIGCGLGEILGMVIGTGLHFNNSSTMVLAIILGAVLGLLFGMVPLFKAKHSLLKA